MEKDTVVNEVVEGRDYEEGEGGEALYLVHLSTWQQARVVEADPHVMVCQALKLRGKDDVVANPMVNEKGEKYGIGHRGCR